MNMAQITSSLIFIITIATLITEVQQLNISSIPNDNRLSLNVVPMHYDIQLNLMLIKYDSIIGQPSYIKQQYGSFHFHGESNITIQIRNSTQNIKLHISPNLVINQGNIKLTDNNDRIYIIKETEYNIKTERFDIQFFSILPRGNYTLKVEFYGPITDNNAKSDFVSSSYINREENLILLIAPHIQEVGTRRLFPCWDEPHIKATFNISVKHQRNFTAISNMQIRDYYRDGDGLMTHFHTTPPMSTYQVSVILTNFRHTQIHKHTNDSLRYAKRSRLLSLKYALQVIEKIRLHFESEFNDTKIPKIDHIVIPNYPHNADVSKLGFVFYREADLIYDYKLDPITRKIEIARSVASKIAYQWLGNVITPSWWSHFWLHEGLSILFGEEAVVKVFNNSQMIDFFIVRSQYESLHLDPHFDMNPPQINNLSQVDLIFSFPRYIKGIVVLRMLQNIVTDEVFRNGVLACLHKYKYRSLTFNEFWSIQKEIASLSHKYYVSNDFLNWIIYEHYPVISLTQKETNIDLVQLSQYFNASQNSYIKWWIPIRLMTKFSLKRHNNIWITPEKPSLSVVHTAKDDWIMVDIRQAGYYRVKYDMENLRKIALYLNSGAYKNISVINRAKIIDDAFHFLLTREINATVFWELAKYLTQETDYVAWYPMLKVFEYISTVFPLINGEINFMHVKETMREILTKPLKVLGFEEHPLEEHLIKRLRQEIIIWACIVELPECHLDNIKSKQIVGNPALLKILPRWKSFLYCEGIRLMSLEGYEKMQEWVEHRINCYKDGKALFLDFNHFWHTVLKLGRQHGIPQWDIRKRIDIFHLFITTHAKNDTMLKKILYFFHDLKPREMTTTAALINIINHIYSTATLNNVLTYYLKKKKWINSKEEKLIDLGQIESKVYKKIEYRTSEINRHIEHLDMLLNYTLS